MAGARQDPPRFELIRGTEQIQVASPMPLSTVQAHFFGRCFAWVTPLRA